MRPLLFWTLAAGGLSEARGQYHLFSPRPTSEMRELSTDRPDQTESPYTVDAGHLQLEMDLLNWTRDTAAGTRTDSLSLAPFNLKLGLAQNIDLQLVLETWTWQRESGRQHSRTSGLGDVTIRWKQNLWGNDGGATALAIMPYVTIPTRASDLGRQEAEGGVVVPFGWNMPNGLYLGLQTQWDMLPTDTGGKQHAWFNSATVGFDITDRLGGYVEVTATVFGDDSPWQSTLDGGMTFALSENVQLDLGCNFGLTESAPDVQPFVGLTYRY
jgi:hypothetical protein